MKRIFVCALVLLLAALPLRALAATIPDPGDDFYYLDTANVLSEETEGMIYFCNSLLYEKCGGQIVIAALDSIGSGDIYDYAYDLFNQWGIGSAEENNGFLLLMAIEEDNYYALTGSGIDGVFSSSVLKNMNDTYLEPDFAAKDYDSGARKYFEAVLARYADYYNLNLSVADGVSAYQAYISRNSANQSLGGARSGGGYYDDESSSFWNTASYDHHSDHDDGFFSGLFGIIALLFIISVISKMRGGSFLMWSLIRMLGNSSRSHHYGSHRHQHNRRPPRSGGFGGGFSGGGRSSFGGFGGGRSGGGRSFGGGAGRGRH